MSNKPTYEELGQRIKGLEKRFVEQKRSEETLREKNNYFRSLINGIHEDILVIDRNYRITDMNKMFQATSGRKREDVIGHCCYEISHGYNEPCENYGEECVIQTVFETGKPCSTCHQHIHAEGWSTWVDILMSPIIDGKGKVTHVIEAVREVTDIIKAGKALRDNIDKSRRQRESALRLVWFIDIECRITFVNEAIKSMLGYEVHEILDSYAFLSMPLDYRDRFQELFQKSLKHKHGWKNKSICWLHKNGSLQFFESTAQAILDSEGLQVGFIVIDRKINNSAHA